MLAYSGTGSGRCLETRGLSLSPKVLPTPWEFMDLSNQRIAAEYYDTQIVTKILESHSLHCVDTWVLGARRCESRYFRSARSGSNFREGCKNLVFGDGQVSIPRMSIRLCSHRYFGVKFDIYCIYMRSYSEEIETGSFATAIEPH